MPVASVLGRYEAALAARAVPRFAAFSFSIEQVGPHNLSQTHRVYRDGSSERDETLAVDGLTLRRPDVRIFQRRSNRYDVGAVAPLQSAYLFKLTGTQRDGDHDDYIFATTARGARPFAVTELVVDGQHFLPVELAFHIASSSVRAQGRLAFARYDKYWLIREAEVTAHGNRGPSARERIVWTQYQFPSSLPASTFSARSQAVDAGSVLPKPPPALGGEPLPRGSTRPVASGVPTPSKPSAAPVATRRPAAPVPVPEASAVVVKPHHPPSAPPETEIQSTPLQGPVTPAAVRTATPVPATPGAPGTAAPAAPGAGATP